MRVLVAGIGYRNLRDHSVGVMVTDLLEGRQWPEGVVVEDLSYGPIAVVQRLEDDPPERRPDRAVFVAAAARGDRRPGTVTAYRWDGVLPSAERIQGAVCEAVTGVIALDNTLVVAQHFRALPEEVVVVEVEPDKHEAGETLGGVVGEAFEPLCELVTRLALDPAAAARLAVAPLGGALPAVKVR